MDSIGSANVTRDGLVSGKEGGKGGGADCNANSNKNTNSRNTNNPTYIGNGIQCMDSNGTLSALPGQQVEASVTFKIFQKPQKYYKFSAKSKASKLRQV